MPRKPRKPKPSADFSESDPLRSADDGNDVADLAKTLAREADEVELNQIIAWAITGIPELELRQRIARELPNLNAKEALIAAMARIAASAESDPGIVMAWTFEAARGLFREMYKAGDYAEALKALKFINDTAARMADPKSRRDVPVTPPQNVTT